MDWAEFVDLVENRLGQFTGLPRYERAVALVVGFDLGARTEIGQRLQQRVQDQRDAGPIHWSTALLWEVTGEPRPDMRTLTAAQDAAAIALLCSELREVLGSD